MNETTGETGRDLPPAPPPLRRARRSRPAAPRQRTAASAETVAPAEESRGKVIWGRIRHSFLFQVVIAFTVMGLILSFIAKPYLVPSGSMEETLTPGDRVLVNRLDQTPERGDVFVFDADDSWQVAPTPPRDALVEVLRWVGRVSGFGPSGENTLIKRVIGLPGETVECCNDAGAIVVDGTAIDEPYLGSNFPFTPGSLDCSTTPRSARCFDAIAVPEDRYLMLGDNRAASSDSAAFCRSTSSTPACWRWASKESLVGKAVSILWPISRWKGL